MSTTAATPPAAFERLVRNVRSCFACAEMNHVHVLSRTNGTLRARVMFIGEAPGRLGAARTGVPFTSDQSGLRFQRLLAAAGLRREDIFLTNALLCNPLRNGANRPPRRRELAACARWLEAQVDLVDAPLVVTLGTAALDALRIIEPPIRTCFAGTSGRRSPGGGGRWCRSTTPRRGRRASGHSNARSRTSGGSAPWRHRLTL